MDENALHSTFAGRGHLGGVARRTRETILLCEAAGYENIFVETVGVGQSETAVRSMTDFFLLLMLAGAGDELQGMKRGIIEMIDGMAINKADGDNEAKPSRRDRNMQKRFVYRADWSPRVLTVSSITGKGITELWDMILEHRARLESTGLLAQRRRAPSPRLDARADRDRTRTHLSRDAGVSARLPQLEAAVQEGSTTPFAGSARVAVDIPSASVGHVEKRYPLPRIV